MLCYLCGALLLDFETEECDGLCCDCFDETEDERDDGKRRLRAMDRSERKIFVWDKSVANTSG